MLRLRWKASWKIAGPPSEAVGVTEAGEILVVVVAAAAVIILGGAGEEVEAGVRAEGEKG